MQNGLVQRAAATSTPLELINAFPVTPDWVYKDTWTLLCFAANNGITFEQWLVVGYKKHRDLDKWRTQWRGVMPKRKYIYGEMAEDGTYPDGVETFIPSEFKPKIVHSICFMLQWRRIRISIDSDRFSCLEIQTFVSSGLRP